MVSGYHCMHAAAAHLFASHPIHDSFFHKRCGRSDNNSRAHRETATAAVVFRPAINNARYIIAGITVGGGDLATNVGILQLELYSDTRLILTRIMVLPLTFTKSPTPKPNES